MRMPSAVRAFVLFGAFFAAFGKGAPGAVALRAAEDLPWMGSAASLRPGHARIYECRKVETAPRIDGFLTDPAWETAAPAQPLADVVTGAPARLRTRFRAVWDDSGFYVGISAEEPDVWGTLTRHDSLLYEENNLEIFFDPGGDSRNYVELEFNALNTVWDLIMDRPYGEDGEADNGFSLPGLDHAVQVYGTLNHGGDEDRGWTLEVKIPWEGLRRADVENPPTAGTEWPFNVTRVEWRRVKGADGRYVRDPAMKLSWKAPEAASHEENMSWSHIGRIHFHLLDRWGRIRFVAPPGENGR